MNANSSSPRVVVCHPGRQHSHQLALALAEQGMLIKYITGVPTNPRAASAWLRPFLRQYSTAYAIDIQPPLVTHIFVAPLVRRVAHSFASRAAAVKWSHRGEAWFDWLAARELTALKPDVVVCYENAALETFRAAKKLGIRAVLDAASFHHAWQDRFYDPVESPTVHQQIGRRKDEEIGLADHVLTVSELARQSYVMAGVKEEHVTAIPMGVDLDAFAPRRESRAAGPVRFVYVGHMDERKGVDVLAAAASELDQRGCKFELTTIGNGSSTRSFADIGRSKHLGWLPRVRLAAELATHDVLVLPSRHDSFGIVVAEAMACGLPVIVTENVGAKEMVTPGDDGQIVPVGDAAALASAMNWFMDHAATLPEMSAAARSKAESYSWAAYQSKVVSQIREICGVQSAPALAASS